MTSSRLGCSDAFMLAARMRDRRVLSRRRTARLVQVAHEGEAAYARCRDFSDTGMKLDLSTPVDINDPITVALSPSIVLCGSVAWVNGRECGVAFDCPVDSAALIEAAEPVSRQPAAAATRDMLDGWCGTSEAAAEVAARGKSKAAKGFQAGLAVTVMAGSQHERRGVMRWLSGNIAALELENEPEGDQPPQALLPAPEAG